MTRYKDACDGRERSSLLNTSLPPPHFGRLDFPVPPSPQVIGDCSRIRMTDSRRGEVSFGSDGLPAQLAGSLWPSDMNGAEDEFMSTRMGV